MSLDFVVLGQHGSPEKTVPLNVDLHHELITAAANHGLTLFGAFDNYYEDVEIVISNLSGLAEQVEMLRVQAGSINLRRFLDDLSGLIAYAVSNGKALHAIAD
jgi:hypothetical protein